MKAILLFLLLSLYAPACSGNSFAIPSLDQCRTTDPMLADVTSRVEALIAPLAGESLARIVRLFVIDYSKPDADRIPSDYRTNSCKAVMKGDELAVIVCDAALFLEIEAVIRAFLLGSDIIPTDEKLFELVRMIGSDPIGYLREIRYEAIPGLSMRDTNEQIATQMKLMMFFFVAHEFGHVRDRVSGHEFVAPFTPDAPIDVQVSEAVVRLAKHAQEFEKLGFGLPGWEEVNDPDGRMHASQIEHRAKHAILYENYDMWYQAEDSADKYASSIMVKYLNGLASRNETNADEEQHFFISNLFFSAIYSWYKSFYSFSVNACDGLVSNSLSLTICMMRDRRMYVKSASLFGDTYRFLLLRNVLAIEDIMKQRIGYFSIYEDRQTIQVSEDEWKSLGSEERTKVFWRAANLQKYFLLCILMDTPVKIAYVGAATGWLMEMDSARGSPQLLMMMFETITQAIQRVMAIP